jgi:hypothetical protein
MKGRMLSLTLEALAETAGVPLMVLVHELVANGAVPIYGYSSKVEEAVGIL